MSSAAYQWAMGEGGIGLDAMNKNIQDFFAANPDQAATEAAMQQWGVSNEDIQRATGKSFADYYPVIKAPSTGPLGSIAYQNAISEGGIGLDAMNQNIQSFLAANPTEQATRDAMQQFGVSEEDIQRATGRSFADYYPSQGALPVSNTYTVDRYNPNDPASSHWIADPNAGHWTFNTETGERTLVPAGSTSGALSTVTAPASDVSITSRDDRQQDAIDAATVKPAAN
ncbi:MAG: hypothetical protein EBR82_54870, partial [Caulobacteraceae bacterium]|nr:hypothetical protein [Caulobacteraceae bacterium]